MGRLGCEPREPGSKPGLPPLLHTAQGHTALEPGVSSIYRAPYDVAVGQGNRVPRQHQYICTELIFAFQSLRRADIQASPHRDSGGAIYKPLSSVQASGPSSSAELFVPISYSLLPPPHPQCLKQGAKPPGCQDPRKAGEITVLSEEGDHRLGKSSS